MEVCSAGMMVLWLCGGCSPSFSLIRLRCGGLNWPGAWSLAYVDRDVCVSTVVGCSSLVMHGNFHCIGEYM